MKEFGVVVCSAAGSWNGTPMIKVHSTLFTRITKNKAHHHPFVLLACVRGRQTIERGKGQQRAVEEVNEVEKGVPGIKEMNTIGVSTPD